MSFPLDISTLDGRCFSIEADSLWSVRDLKGALAKNTGFGLDSQKVVTNAGVELQDGRAIKDYCSVNVCEQLTLVEMLKTDQELKWLEKWHETTPDWLKDATEIVMDNADFTASKTEVAQQENEEVPALTTPTELLRAMRRAPQALSTLSDGTVKIGKTRQEVATEVVLAAIEREPRIMLAHADFSFALFVVKEMPDVYAYLPEDIQNSRFVLYAALDKDEALKEEFLRTAGKREIHEWQWYAQDAGCKRGKRR